MSESAKRSQFWTATKAENRAGGGENAESEAVEE
jgi:hypothetical protein